ncbi:Acetamidase/Formamidase [Thermincola ferriacetica]|uniref:Acetamidase/Formamidase n=1 Tax=Thermincola ferriacetica TaxID=281456 RepID=A0A0L6W5Y1_9FIRM|nr:acetamidase/formamidase family protein [Thermincola ferriacetica]KNZ70982.1 Acetamidase/Formamidase [Thermincola ferriacetica]
MKIRADKVIYGFNPDLEAVAVARSGDVIVFETLDCFANQIVEAEQSVDNIDWEQINPATGPVYIKDARPGDSIRVSILKIDLADRGVMAAIPDCGVLGNRVKEPEIKILPIKGSTAYFNDIALPVKPMVGVIGVAPASGEIPCGIPGAHGGNLDTNLICAGNDLILPVAVPGALLALGDVHARMGDGEVWVTGIEAAAQVTVRVEVLKNFSVKEPVVMNDEITAFLSSAATLDEAVTKVTEYAIDCLVKLGLSFNDAGMLLSAVGDLQISQVVDPLKTVRLVVPRWILTRYGFNPDRLKSL